MAISVNMFRWRVTRERQPRTKNGQPAHQTTAVASANCSQREASPSTSGSLPSAGIRCAIARMNTGSASAAPIQKRLVMSFSSAFAPASGPAAAVIGSSAMPHKGQGPGWSCWIWGCIGHV